MWTRAELKSRAKANLKKYYWAAVVVSMIYGLLFNLGSGSGVSASQTETQEEMNFYQEGVGMVPVPSTSGTLGNMSGLAVAMITGAAIVSVIMGIALSIFVVPVLNVGHIRFYMESRENGKSAGIGKLFWGFSHHYLNQVLTLFLMNLLIVLGTLCFIIPGIWLSFAFFMVPYILSENPDMKPGDVLKLSKEMMDGQKMNTFILSLSFIGWSFLGAITCIGSWFINPYINATYAELYATLRKPYSRDDDTAPFEPRMDGPVEEGEYREVRPEAENTAAPEPFVPETPETGHEEVAKSQGGPGKGYYLNGVYHSYTEDDNS